MPREYIYWCIRNNLLVLRYEDCVNSLSPLANLVCSEIKFSMSVRQIVLFVLGSTSLFRFFRDKIGDIYQRNVSKGIQC